MKNNTKVGTKGEIVAQEFLINKNIKILHTNWRYKHAEIDIIAQDKNRLLFIEVKFRKSNTFGYPEQFVTPLKIKKMKEAADAYIEQFNWQGELRFDIIAIEKENTITHFEDAFY